jgi:hypothetical protein
VKQQIAQMTENKCIDGMSEQCGGLLHAERKGEEQWKLFCINQYNLIIACS